MNQVLTGIFASGIFAIGANYLYAKWGARVLWPVTVLVAALLWGAAALKPTFVMASMDGRPYSFFTTITALWALIAAVLLIQVLALARLGQVVRAGIAGVAAFSVWFCGGFVS